MTHDEPTYPPVPGSDEPEPEEGSGASRLTRRASRAARRAAVAGREVMMEAGSRARRVWLPDDPAAILGSPAFSPFPEGGPPSEMLSVAWMTDALAAVSALGIEAWEHEIVGFTRAVFHDGLRHQELSRRLFGRDFDEVHRWIDTVPGSGVRGGGIVHRLRHGHDVAAAAELYRRHGVVGVLVWIQHVAQDAATPTGIPMPMGGRTLAGWLVEAGFATSGKAALLCSFNAAQLTAVVLGAKAFTRIASLTAEVPRKARIARRCAAAREAWTRGDLDAMVANYAEARALAPDEPAVLMSLGWAYAQMGRPAAESFLAFRDAALSLAAEDRAVQTGGAALSMRGLAYLLALVHAVGVLDDLESRGPWRDELDRMLRGALAAFECMALEQAEGPSVALGARHVPLYRARPFSAAANYYVAARLAFSVPFLPASHEAPRLAGRALELLDFAGRADPGSSAQAARTRDRWSQELSGIGIAVPAVP